MLDVVVNPGLVIDGSSDNTAGEHDPCEPFVRIGSGDFIAEYGFMHS